MKTQTQRIALVVLTMALTCSSLSTAGDLPDLAALRKMNARLTPVDLSADVSRLAPGERQALIQILQAAKLMDVLFMRQGWAGNESLLLDLLQDRTLLGQERLRAFLLNRGPWSRLDQGRAFLPGIPEKPAQSNYYPAGATKAELEKWMKGLPAKEKDKAAGFFTTIRRSPAGDLVIVGYDQEYQPELALAAAYLRQAAQLTQTPSLKDFLEKRAAAFLSNNYYDSDVAWMKLDASIEPTIGPYETYDDEWFNAKASFEAFITIRDDAETAKLGKYETELQELENNLPIEAKWKNPRLGALSPLRVVNSIFSSGDGNRGVQTAAFNLPNDDRVVLQMGSKRVMLKNVQEAKFHKVLSPIADVVLSPADRKRVSFEAFFTHILMHEIMHGLGPQTAFIGGKSLGMRAALQEHYSFIEEAKADIAGLWAMKRLVDKGVADKSLGDTMYVTFLASCFRSLRFGINEAHGKGIALLLNSLLDAGAFQVSPRGKFSVHAEKIPAAVSALTCDLMTLEAHGDKEKAQAYYAKYVHLRPEVQKALDRLIHIPIDIAPRFVTAGKLLAAGK